MEFDIIYNAAKVTISHNLAGFTHLDGGALENAYFREHFEAVELRNCGAVTISILSSLVRETYCFYFSK